MPRYKIAHIREQGVDLIIIPLESSYGYKSSEVQHQEIAALQARTVSAGLSGTVVPVWDSGGGRMSFIAPNNWHSYFKGLTLQFVFANINKELTW